MTKYLLFDADNTLFDFDAAEESALNETLPRFGYPAGEANKAIYRAINNALWAAFDRSEISLDDLEVRRFVEFSQTLGSKDPPEAWSKRYLNALARGGQLLPGAEALCADLAERYTLVLATNGIPRVQRARLSASPVAPYFGDRVFISGELGCRKPEKVYFDRVLQTLHAKPETCAVIGDSLSTDILGANRAQIPSIWYDPKRKPNTGPGIPDHIVYDFTRLRALLALSFCP